MPGIRKVWPKRGYPAVRYTQAFFAMLQARHGESIVEASWQADHEYSPSDFDWDYLRYGAREFAKHLAQLKVLYPDEHEDTLKDMLWSMMENPHARTMRPARFRKGH